MKRKHLITTISICLLCMLFCISGCQTPVDTVSSSLPAVTEKTKISTDISEMRVFSLADIEPSSLCYDTVCYMLFNELMTVKKTDFADSNSEVFAPDSITTLFDAAKALSITLPEETKDATLTRGKLATMLYSAAKNRGISTEVALSALPYRDANEAKPEEVTALLWTTEKGLFSSFVGLRLLPNTAVSRIQLAEAVIFFKALDTNDSLAAEIASAIPSRKVYSSALNNHSSIQQIIDSSAKRHGAVGVQVAVIENGVVTDTFTYGYATKDTDPMTTDHKIRTASITKVAVGTAAWLLYEDRKIALDTDISHYWNTVIKNPTYPEDKITVRTLLTHTSSIYDAPYGTPRKYDDIKSLLTNGGYSESRPGHKWKYNNYAFAVLGITLERAGGVTLNDLLHNRVFAPLDMDAAFSTGDIKNTDLLATVYRNSGAVGLSVDAAKSMHCGEIPGTDGSHFAGGLTMSAYDLAKFISLLANDGIYEGIRILDAETIRLMESYSKNTVSNGFYQAMPLRFKKNLYGRNGIYFHTGSSYGVFNSISYDPESGDGVIVLTTGADGIKGTAGIYQICAEINEYIYNAIEEKT